MPSLTEMAKGIVEIFKDRWTGTNHGLEEALDRVEGWANAKMKIQMLGWLAKRTDEQILEEAVEMVSALEEVAYTSNITKMGEGIMTDLVELCTILTSRRADTLKDEGLPGEKAVIPACSNGMPGSLSKTSPGGTCSN